MTTHKKHRMNPASLANLKQLARPGFRTATVRIFAPEATVEWFRSQPAFRRGLIATEARIKEMKEEK